MFLLGFFIGATIALLIDKSRFEKRARHYWEKPRAGKKISEKELLELSSAGESHFAALKWVGVTTPALIPFEIFLLSWVCARGKEDEFKSIDGLAYKSLLWRVGFYRTMLENGLTQAAHDIRIEREIKDSTWLEVAMTWWTAMPDDWHISYRNAIEKLGGYQDFGEFIEGSSEPDAIKKIVFKNFFY